MAIRKIVQIGDDILRKKCREVTVFDEKLHTLLDDMYETMTAANGVGLAAPQVGILRRLCSVVGRSGIVERPAVVKFRAYDRFGKPFEKVVNKLAARAICHENDHLDGRLYVDIMTEEVEHE